MPWHQSAQLNELLAEITTFQKVNEGLRCSLDTVPSRTGRPDRHVLERGRPAAVVMATGSLDCALLPHRARSLWRSTLRAVGVLWHRPARTDRRHGVEAQEQEAVALAGRLTKQAVVRAR